MNRDHNHYRLITENSFDAIALIDLEGNYIYCNRAFEENLGYAPAELIGRNSFEIVHQDDRVRAVEMLQSGLATGQTEANLVLRLLCKDGTEKVCEHKVKLLFNEAGEPGQLLVIGIDITERYLAEKELQASEERYRLLVNNASEAIVVVQGDRLKFLNPMALSILGYTEEYLLETPFIDLIYPDDLAVTLERYQELLYAKSTGEKSVTRVIAKDRVIKWVEFSGVAINWHDQPALLGFINDITERRKVEENLSLQSLVLDQIKDYVTITDLDGIITYVNRVQEEQTGMLRAEIIGKPTGVFGEDAEQGATQQEILDVTLRDGSWRGEVVNFAADGSPIVLDCRTQVIYDTNGAALALCGISTDITDRKRVEEQVRFISLHDTLTGLYNRNFLDEEMARLDTIRQRPVSILMADLNGLKLVNDTYGHAHGDEVLKSASEILKNACREEDIIARWGGDEFVVLLPQTTLVEALKINKRIMDICERVTVEGVPVSMALGAAVKEDDSKDLAEVLRDAEDNMYKQKLTESRSTKSAVLKALLKTLAEKSYETEAHARRMQKVAQKIGRKLELPASELSRLDLLITLHDIGKINISEEILTKKGSLTEEEWIVIKQHPEIGFRIARATEDFTHIAEDILSHHERWDGTGYPGGLKGEDIPLLARITAVADAYEVMSNGRPYKKALTHQEIVAEFRRCSGTHFDPKLIEVFLDLFEADHELIREVVDT